MGTYNGPKCKICRRNRVKLYLKGSRCESAKCAIEKRNYTPGQRSVVPKKISEFGRRLREKQKLRFFYGVSERQIRIYFEKARRSKGITGDNLLSHFERRLDNVVFRLGVGTSRKESRQIVGHGHFQVNGIDVDVPSYIVKEGDLVSLKRLNDGPFVVRFDGKKGTPAWLVSDPSAKAARVAHLPRRDEIDVPVEEQLVVEFYSR
ncbi:30S ribosomal protein S4 [bacterium]|nr:30S ribosomal protein S4 [bacterium]